MKSAIIGRYFHTYTRNTAHPFQDEIKTFYKERYSQILI